ncbi:hypothetical protein EHQ53_15940 [Leptospira langatensis]|uniref:Lipoprotein n=1 Tax=Leptospira langatensis TaxID=2484983 RepID=A0A5F1ZPR5_9LEPT|nr:hypothetical protein [Leptospira langatensis]TGK05136.1 hypothetical protein EHO57_00180 [Leptospira langatensis]TGL38273.1 hypothetical protein EHQ53_15940 [Leptospira langatensis]
MNRSIKKVGYFLGLTAVGIYALNCGGGGGSSSAGAALAGLLGGTSPGVYISGTLVDGTPTQNPLANATVQIVGRGESSVTVLVPDWAKNSVSTVAPVNKNSSYYMSSGGVYAGDKIPAGFLYNNSQGAGNNTNASDGSVTCDTVGNFDATTKTNSGANCPATYITSVAKVFANPAAGTDPGVDFVKAQCGQASIDQINAWAGSGTFPAGQYYDGVTAPTVPAVGTDGAGYKVGPLPVAFKNTTVRVYCDVSTLDTGATSVGINTTVQTAGTIIGTFKTDANGKFNGVKLIVPSVGNTYNVIVTTSGGATLKPRRLKINKNGVATLLVPVSEKPANAALELSTGKDLTSTESSWNSYFSGGNVLDDRGSYDFSFGSVSVNMVYPKTGNIISGTLSGNAHLTKAGSPYVLSGTVIVPNGITMTIDAGVTVFGAVSPAGALLVKAGGKLIANGTAAEPILFTSSKDAGTRAPADWQGIIIQGKGVQTFGCGGNAGGCQAIGEGDTGAFGGTDNTDSSGHLSYVVAQFAGAPFSPGNERNCISLMGVGSGTAFDHIQCHRGFDDGYEQWGGAFTAKYMVSSANRDDQFDFADGFIGKYQFGISHLVANAIAANDDVSRCIEGDGNSALACTGDARTGGGCANPYFANITCVGAGNVTNGGGAIFVRRAAGAAGQVVGDYTHFLVDNHGTQKALDCTSDSAPSNANVSYVSINGTAVGACTGDGGADVNTDIGAAAIAVTSTSATAPNYFPAAAATVTGSRDTTTVRNFSDPFFTTATYYGAIDPSGTDWTTGWTQFPAN